MRQQQLREDREDTHRIAAWAWELQRIRISRKRMRELRFYPYERRV